MMITKGQVVGKLAAVPARDDSDEAPSPSQPANQPEANSASRRITLDWLAAAPRRASGQPSCQWAVAGAAALKWQLTR
ncbi:hypothetical protein MY4824_003636 [Beauveria thailandica]